MRKIITGLLLGLIAINCSGQSNESKLLPKASQDFFKKVPRQTLKEVITKELSTFLELTPINDKMKEQWKINSQEELKSLRFSVIIPVLRYNYAATQNDNLEDPDMFYVPLYLNGEIKIIASVSKMEDGYHISNFGWPIIANQLNESKSAIQNSANLAYIELADITGGLLINNNGNYLDQKNFQVLKLVLPGTQSMDAKFQTLNFKELVSRLYNSK